ARTEPGSARPISASCHHIEGVIALRLAGRSSTTVATSPSTVSRSPALAAAAARSAGQKSYAAGGPGSSGIGDAVLAAAASVDAGVPAPPLLEASSEWRSVRDDMRVPALAGEGVEIPRPYRTFSSAHHGPACPSSAAP